MTEKEFLSSISKLEKRYLSRRICGLCEKQLDRCGCLSIYEGCTEEVRVTRAINCLREYKPRGVKNEA